MIATQQFPRSGFGCKVSLHRRPFARCDRGQLPIGGTLVVQVTSPQPEEAGGRPAPRRRSRIKRSSPIFSLCIRFLKGLELHLEFVDERLQLLDPLGSRRLLLGAVGDRLGLAIRGGRGRGLAAASASGLLALTGLGISEKRPPCRRPSWQARDPRLASCPGARPSSRRAASPAPSAGSA